MISVADARARILARMPGPTPPELLPLTQALGRTLARDVTAPFDVPSADNSAVDGYAVRAADLEPSRRARLRVVRDLPAGEVFAGTLAPGEAVRIMTGALIPADPDTVVPQEQAEPADGAVPLQCGAPGATVRALG